MLKLLITIISVLYVPIIVFMFVDEGVFWGLIGITFAILGLGIPYLVIFRKRTSEMQILIDLAIGQIYEKIAVLEGYVNEVSTWKEKGIDPTKRTNRICYDIKSLWRIKGMPPEQKSELSGVIRRLIEAMEKDYKYEAGRIKDASTPLLK
jgi:hypothetical protein